MSYFGVELNSQCNRLIFDMRLHLSRNKYAPNLRTIYRSFVQFDPECSGKIPPHHFETALNHNGIFMKKFDVQLFQKTLDKQGYIDWFEFLRRLRQPMGPLRQQLIECIFDSMDKDKKCSIPVNQLMEHFNPTVIEYYQTGRMSADQVRDHFLSLLVINQDAISRQEFLAFYNDVNVNFAHNDIFITLSILKSDCPLIHLFYCKIISLASTLLRIHVHFLFYFSTLPIVQTVFKVLLPALGNLYVQVNRKLDHLFISVYLQYVLVIWAA